MPYCQQSRTPQALSTVYRVPIPPPPSAPNRAIFLLSLAGFASQAMVRVSDSLLPQIAADLAATVGAASIVVTAYSHRARHGAAVRRRDRRPLRQILCLCGPQPAICRGRGVPVRAVAHRCRNSSPSGWSAALPPAGSSRSRWPMSATSFPTSSASRCSAAISPDRFPDCCSDRLPAACSATCSAGATCSSSSPGFSRSPRSALVANSLFNPRDPRPEPARAAHSAGCIAEYRQRAALPLGAHRHRSACSSKPLCSMRCCRFIGADLHLRFGLSFTLIGLVVGCFRDRRSDLHLRRAHSGQPARPDRACDRRRRCGVGRLSHAGHSSRSGGCRPVAMTLIGLGFYMVHNTFQTNATQMAPQARGTAVATVFVRALSRAYGRASRSAAPIVDRYSAVPVFVTSAIGFPILAGVFALGLARKRRADAQAHAARRRISAPARDALDLGAHQPLDHVRQIVVEPGFQHRPQHLLDQIVERAGILRQHGMRE